MKKLLATLTLAPLAITACGGSSTPSTNTPDANKPDANKPDTTPAVEKTDVAYGYTHGGYITKATVKTKGDDIVSVDFDETYSKVDATKTDWSAITADADITKAEAALTSKIKYISFTAPAAKGICLMNHKMFDVKPTTTPTTKEAVYELLAATGKNAVIAIEEGSSVIASVPMNANTCANTLHSGTWVPKSTSAVLTLDYTTILNEAHFNDALAAAAGTMSGLVDAYTISSIVAADHYATQATAAEINATKASSLDIEGIEYGKGKFDWDKSRQAIIKYFKDNATGYKTSNITTANLGNGTGQTAIAGATASDTNDYVKTIQAALKKAMN